MGQDLEKSLVDLYTKLMSNYDKIPPGVSQPLVKPKSIDDVPILSYTFWSGSYSGYDLRRVAQEVGDELKKDKDVAEFQVIGGQKRQLRVTADPLRLTAYSSDLSQIEEVLRKGPTFLALRAFSIRRSGIPGGNRGISKKQ